MNPQVVGMEEIGGTYVFDLRVSNKALKLNRFFWKMIGTEWRARYLQDAESLMTEAGLDACEKDLVRRRDWLGLVQYGANFFVVEKFARVATWRSPGSCVNPSRISHLERTTGFPGKPSQRRPLLSRCRLMAEGAMGQRSSTRQAPREREQQGVN
ncbi:hypothetical protein [Pseudomonas putida]|uniref:hypothetical protein n=1 Tax=Pseudomonas putida TaxID=303 RepID=UPI001E469C49|nr:hypothetical protein [Pseudomonas putida]